MNNTANVIDLITRDQLVHKEDAENRVMSPLERIGLLVSIASRDDVSDCNVNDAVDAIKKLVNKRNASFEKIEKQIGVKVAKPTYVYLMHHGLSNVWKIGRSSDPNRRERTLQHDDPMITLEWSVPALGRFETWLHDRFSDLRLRGEWFKLTDKDVEWIKNNALKVYNECEA